METGRGLSRVTADAAIDTGIMLAKMQSGYLDYARSTPPKSDNTSYTDSYRTQGAKKFKKKKARRKMANKSRQRNR